MAQRNKSIRNKNARRPPDQTGTTGFNPLLSGHAKADHAGTSGFGSGPPYYTLPGYPSGRETAPPELHEPHRMPTESNAGRVKKPRF